MKDGILAVITAHNEIKYIKLNVQILREELRGTDSEIVVVDNFSDDGLHQWLEAQKNISYIICDDKLEGYGEIIKVVTEQFGNGRDLLLLRANCFLTPGSIDCMSAALYSHEDVAAVGPVGNNFGGEQRCFPGDSFQVAQIFQKNAPDETVRTAYLDADVLLLRGDTLDRLETGNVIPQAFVRGYMRNMLRDGKYFAIAKKAVCFAVGDAKDEPYQALSPDVYRQEKLHKLLYHFGDIDYQGVYLYKYLMPDFQACINYHNKFQKMERSRFWAIWSDNGIAVSTEEQAEKTRKVIDSLPQRDVLFVTLPIRRSYQGSLVHTAMETFIASLDEELYLDLECFNEEMENVLKLCPTRNMYPIRNTAIPKIYGIGGVDERELLDFLWNNFVHPLELALDNKFEDEFLRGIWVRAQYILKRRKSYMEFYKEVITRVDPKVIIYSHGQDITLTYLRDAALAMGIPTLEIAHGVAKADTYHKHLVYADYQAVYSDIVATKSREQGNDRVIGIGKPGVYDGLILQEKKPVIVISFISSMENEIFEYARNLARRLDPGRFFVIYKAHNSEVWGKEEKERIEKEVSNLKFLNGGYDIRDCVGMSDIVVGIRTSGLFDALVYPMVKIIAVEDKAINFNEANPKEILQEVIKNGEITLAENEEQLYQEVINYKRGIMYRNKINNFWPGDAKERFRALVDSYTRGTKV